MDHGRTASCPAAPVQIPACGFPAQGSSKLLASYIKVTHCSCYSEIVTDTWSLKIKGFYQFGKPFPVVATSLTTTIQRLEKNPLYLMKETCQAFGVAPNTVIIIVSAKFGV